MFDSKSYTRPGLRLYKLLHKAKIVIFSQINMQIFNKKTPKQQQQFVTISSKVDIETKYPKCEKLNQFSFQ